jgi:uncharacterized membrane protein
VAEDKKHGFKPPKFPYHAVVVHVPVGAWTFAFIFDLLTWLNMTGNTMVRLSFFSIALGLAVALVAVPTGVLDWGGVKPDKPAWKLGIYHMALNLLVTVIFSINLGIRLADWRVAERVGGLPLLLSGVGAILLLISAYIGGRMVYEYGVSVARGSKEKWKKIAEKGGAHIPADN